MLLRKAVLLKKEYKALRSMLDDSYNGDRFIKSAIDKSLTRLNDIIAIKRPSLKCRDKMVLSGKSDKKFESIGLKKILSKETEKWRKNISIQNFNNIPEANKKEVFDCFFRYDTYGSLYNDDILFLSRGVDDSQYFSPPAIVNVAIDVANKHNWFGYSDSLGYIDTRVFIAEQERKRWDTGFINYNNVAVVMGGTHGLDAILSFIKKTTNVQKDWVVFTPTYAPIIESIGTYFGVRQIMLDDQYIVDFNQLTRAIKSDNTMGVLLSVPHNPVCNTKYSDIVKHILPLCKKYSKYIIVDEVFVQDNVSEISDVLNHDKTIIITSYSKSYAIPGLKLGHVIADKQFIDNFYRHASTSYGSPPSFLYLVASSLAKLYNNDLSMDCELVGQFSKVEHILAEFKLWQRQKRLFDDVNKDLLANTFKNDNNYSLILPNNSSCNVVLRADIHQPAYLTMLQLLTDCNVSVMPIECFAPKRYTNHDMRITVSINPKIMQKAAIRIKQKMDSIIEQEALNIKYILWDNDGVLVNTENLFFEATKKALSSIGVKAEYKDFEEVSLKKGQNLIEYYGKRIGFDFGEIVKIRDRLYSQMIADGVELNIGMFDSVKRLKDMGFKNVIVTGSESDNFHTMHKKNKEFLSMFDLIITRSDYKNPKPHPDAYKHAMKQIKAKASECLVIEDSVRGIEAAKKCKIKFVHFKNSKRQPGIFKQIKSKLCI